MTVSRRSALFLLSAAVACAPPRLSLAAASGARQLSFERLQAFRRVGARIQQPIALLSTKEKDAGDARNEGIGKSDAPAAGEQLLGRGLDV